MSKANTGAMFWGSDRAERTPKTFEGGFEAWPSLDEISSVSVQGVNHNRGIDGSVIDTDRAALAARMKTYIGAKKFDAAAARFPELAPPPTEDGKLAVAGYDPEAVWNDLHRIGFDDAKVLSFLTFPLDERFIYYETDTKLLNRPGPSMELTAKATSSC